MGKSKAKKIMKEDVNVTFKDVAGVQEHAMPMQEDDAELSATEDEEEAAMDEATEDDEGPSTESALHERHSEQHGECRRCVR